MGILGLVALYIVGAFILLKYVEVPSWKRSDLSYWVAYSAAFILSPCWIPVVVFFVLLRFLWRVFTHHQGSPDRRE